jgi:cytochrome c556
LVPATGAGFGRFLPIEFREMGLAMHRVAADFAQVAGRAPAEPTAADWQQAMTALEAIAARCRGCHAAFRIE